MDSVDRFLQLMGSARHETAPAVDVSAAVLNSICPRSRAAGYYVDYAPLAISASLVIAASVFLLLSLPAAPTPVNAAVAELVNPISMLVP